MLPVIVSGGSLLLQVEGTRGRHPTPSSSNLHFFKERWLFFIRFFELTIECTFPSQVGYI
jgi:hypothetical protein